MADSIMASVILRNMRGSPSFVRGGALLPEEQRLRLQSSEVVVGTYQNPGPGGCLLVFTDSAISIIDGEQLTRIVWADIVGYESPKTGGQSEGVNVQTRDGTHFVPISGSYGPESKFRDALNLAMVLRSLLGH